MTNEFISLETLAIRLGLSKAFLAELANQSKIPFLTAGGRRRFNEDDVAEALRAIADEQRKGGAA